MPEGMAAVPAEGWRCSAPSSYNERFDAAAKPVVIELVVSETAGAGRHDEGLRDAFAQQRSPRGAAQ